MGTWNKPGIPHKNWKCIGMEDLESPDGVCEMCDQTMVRYMHIMTHSEYPDELRVGCVCAEKMETDATLAKKRERGFKSDLKAAAKRKARELEERERERQYAEQKAARAKQLAVAAKHWAGEEVFRFGKHKGQRVKDIPRDYLEWCEANLKNSKIVNEIRIYLEIDKR